VCWDIGFLGFDGRYSITAKKNKNINYFSLRSKQPLSDLWFAKNTKIIVNAAH